MNCPECGKQIHKDSNFCMHCGVRVRGPNGAESNIETCRICGGEVAVVCESCGEGTCHTHYEVEHGICILCTIELKESQLKDSRKRMNDELQDLLYSRDDLEDVVKRRQQAQDAFFDAWDNIIEEKVAEIEQLKAKLH